MLNSLKRQVEWLEHRTESLKKAANTFDQSSEYIRGFDKGILFAVKQYEADIQELKQMLEGFLVEDVDFEGSEEVEAV